MQVKPRSQRDLLVQLKSLVAASGNEKKFLLAHEALNVDKVGRTTVYDALHGKKIGIKLTALLDRIIADQNQQISNIKENGGILVVSKDGKESLPSSMPPKFTSKKKAGNRPVIVDDSVEVAKGSKYQLSRPVTSYVKQLKSLIAASGSERKFFTDYAKFNVAGAVRSSVYTAVHDGKVRRALAQMLDGILAAAPDVKLKPQGRKTMVTGHGVEVLPNDNLDDIRAEVENA